MLESGIDIYNGGTPPVLVRRGIPGSLPLQIPAALMLAADVDAANAGRYPLQQIEDVFTAQLTNAEDL